MFDLNDLPEAEFVGPLKGFDHFESAEHPNCFACNSRLMLVCPRAVTDKYVLLQATLKRGEGFALMPHVYLAFPRVHVESFWEMPDDWTACVKDAAARLDLYNHDVNFSDNWGKDAGQTVAHGHTWIIDRSALARRGLTIDVGLASLLYQQLLGTPSL